MTDLNFIEASIARLEERKAKIEQSGQHELINSTFPDPRILEEYRSAGLALIRAGYDVEGTNLIINFLKESFIEAIDYEFNYIDGMQTHAMPLTFDLIEKLESKNCKGFHSNIELPAGNALITPIFQQQEKINLSLEKAKDYAKINPIGWIDRRVLSSFPT